MIQNRTILAMIPARGGSKGIKDKNITPLAGKPLITYTIEAALKSRYIDRVVVSTDSEKIAKVARNAGADVPFLRPAELASDTAKSIDAVLHCIQVCQGDIFLLLQPTSPLRTAEDIDAAIETFIAHGEKGLCSVNEIGDHPILTRTMDGERNLQPLLHYETAGDKGDGSECHLGVQVTFGTVPFVTNSTVRRQDMPAFYHVNGAIYINRIDEINRDTSFNDNPVGYVMPRQRSVDIDTAEDLKLAEVFLNESKGQVQ